MTQTSRPRSGLIQQLICWVEFRPRLTLVLLVLAALAPFAAKPFNLDDPLFVWAAKHIQTNPTNPYDFTVNWYGIPSPMWQVTKNPPMTCYYIALAASVVGWSEFALHCAFLVPAVAVIMGTYRLAGHFCDRPLFAAGTTLFMPVFLISSTSLMCDILMLAFWVWAVVLWVEGLAKPDFGRLIGSAFLMALAAYTKYYGICLVPLLAAYGIMKERRIGSWAACFLIPITGMIAYQWVTFKLYGRGLFSDAGDFATHEKSFEIFRIATSGLTALAYIGGCAAVATLLAPWLWRKRVLALLGLGTAAFAWTIFAKGSWWSNLDPLRGSSHGLLGTEVIFWAIGGVSVLGLAVVEAWQRRDAGSYLLALWIWGTFLFAGFVNWTLNGRSILPLAPAVAILLARRLPLKLRAGKKISQPAAGIYTACSVCSVIAALVALLVTRADYNFAQASRQSAEETYAKYGHGAGTLWFLGHWGWQYYIEQLGAKALDSGHASPPNGDFLAVPRNNTNVGLPNNKMARLQEIFPINEWRLLATSSEDVGAGFYASAMGPLPFAFGKVPPEKIYVFVIGPPL